MLNKGSPYGMRRGAAVGQWIGLWTVKHRVRGSNPCMPQHLCPLARY